MGADKSWFAFFNPEIVQTAGETVFEEGCLSFPGLFLPIKRPEMVTLKYQDMNGKFEERDFSGLSARIILHECDHMEGEVFTKKLPKLLVDRAKTKIHKNLKILARQKEQDEKNAIIRAAYERVVATEKVKPNGNHGLTVTL